MGVEVLVARRCQCLAHCVGWNVWVQSPFQWGLVSLQKVRRVLLLLWLRRSLGCLSLLIQVTLLKNLSLLLGEQWVCWVLLLLHGGQFTNRARSREEVCWHFAWERWLAHLHRLEIANNRSHFLKLLVHRPQLIILALAFLGRIDAILLKCLSLLPQN